MHSAGLIEIEAVQWVGYAYNYPRTSCLYTCKHMPVQRNAYSSGLAWNCSLRCRSSSSCSSSAWLLQVGARARLLVISCGDCSTDERWQQHSQQGNMRFSTVHILLSVQVQAYS